MSDKVDRSLQHKCRNSVRIRAPAPSSLLVCVSGELGTTEPTGDMTKDTLKFAEMLAIEAQFGEPVIDTDINSVD